MLFALRYLVRGVQKSSVISAATIEEANNLAERYLAFVINTELPLNGSLKVPFEVTEIRH